MIASPDRRFGPRNVLVFTVAMLCIGAIPMVAADAPAPAASPRTGLMYGPVYLEHQTSKGHPERPERLEAIVKQLKDSGLWEQLVLIEPRDAGLEWLATIHSPQYVQRVKLACERGDALLDSADVPISKESYAVAVKAAGGVLSAVDAVMDRKAANAFCAVRPPGHHALADRAMGFCIFDNIAVAARYIQKKHKLAKVLIVDWDVHHGNGTQAAFYDDPTVFYFSIHRSPFYPGSGAAMEKGRGKGEGFTLNVPMAQGAGDADYIAAVKGKLIPAANAFKPDFVLVSAGFDAHEDDPLGGMKLTSRGYAELTRIVKEIAREHCAGRLVSVLEGGYDLRGLATSVEAHIRVLMEAGAAHPEH
ncbi:MAG: histone deacetylase [Tepidisphaerales bacterium]